MKTRTDFVSNSSSSSFIMRIDFNQYPFEAFVKSICDQCDAGEDDKETYRANEAILKYCLTFNERLFLGTLYLGKEKHTYKRGIGYDDKPVESEEDLDSTPFAYWDQELDKTIYPEATYAKEYVFENEVKKIDPDTIETNEPITINSDIIVTSSFMQRRFRDYWSKPQNVDNRRFCVNKIVEFAKLFNEDNLHLSKSVRLVTDYDSHYHAETYCITQNTIDNTRWMLECGLDVRLEKWQDLDVLEARVKAGQTIFHVVVGDSGEGRDDYRLFSNSTHHPFDNIPVESVCSDW